MLRVEEPEFDSAGRLFVAERLLVPDTRFNVGELAGTLRPGERLDNSPGSALEVDEI